MIQAFGAFAKQLLASGGFKVTEFPAKAYRELLTGFDRLKDEQLVMLPGMIALAKAHPGYWVADDTKNPKYGLLHLAKKLKILYQRCNSNRLRGAFALVGRARDGAFSAGICPQPQRARFALATSLARHGDFTESP